MIFTKKQFDSLVSIQQKYFPNDVAAVSYNSQSIVDEVMDNDIELYRLLGLDFDAWNIAAALMNPTVRDKIAPFYVKDYLELGEENE